MQSGRAHLPVAGLLDQARHKYLGLSLCQLVALRNVHSADLPGLVLFTRYPCHRDIWFQWGEKANEARGGQIER